MLSILAVPASTRYVFKLECFLSEASNTNISVANLPNKINLSTLHIGTRDKVNGLSVIIGFVFTDTLLAIDLFHLCHR